MIKGPGEQPLSKNGGCIEDVFRMYSGFKMDADAGWLEAVLGMPEGCFEDA